MSDKLSKYGYSFQTKLISAVLTDATFISQTYDILKDTYFDSEAIKWIIRKVFQYYSEYKRLATLDVLKVYCDKIDDALLREEIKNALKDSINQIESSDLTFVKTETITFCKNQELKTAILESVEYLKAEKYDSIKERIDKALKVGISNDIGLNYLEDIETRYSEDSRDPISTGWTVLDELLKGGLSGGDLGVFVASSGAGKCIGPESEIEIQYEQIGIDLFNITGKDITVWLNPWNSIEVDNKIYQVHDIINLFSIVSISKQVT